MRRLVNSALRGLLLGAVALACGPVPKSKQDPSDFPKTPAEVFAMGQEYANNSDFLRAEQYMSAALQAGYDEPKAIHQLLEVCLEASFLRSGVKHAQRHLRRHPEDTEVRLSLAALLYGLSELEQAIKEIELVLAQEPDFARAHYLYGVVAHETGEAHHPEAITHYEKYLHLQPEGSKAVEVRMKLQDIRGAPKKVEYPDVEKVADAGIPDVATATIGRTP